MVFIVNLSWVFILINVVLHVSSDDCNLISNYIASKNLFIINTNESIEFIPSGL